MTADALHFAHLTDIHISAREESWGTLSSPAEHLLAETINHLNTLPDLDFVLITGDVLDTANRAEVDSFTHHMEKLTCPWHLTPGNHDGFYDPDMPEAFAPHEALPLLDARLADPRPDAQKAHWSRTVKEGVQLIGLDSRMADSWNGVIAQEQLDWLASELEAHRDDLVLIALHHPIHHLTPINTQPWWSNFVCDNGPEVEALLDRYPNVRMVIAGHHHASQISRRSGRLHVNTAALSGYPCVFRDIRLKNTGAGWQARIETLSEAGEEIRKLAYDKALDSKTARRYDAPNPDTWAIFVEGREADRFYEGPLS